MQFVSYVESVYPKVYKGIADSQDISTETHEELKRIVQEFKTLFVLPDGKNA